MKRKELKNYESPVTCRTQVMLESGICAGSATVTNPNEDVGRIKDHEVNTDFSADFSTSSWD